MVPWFLCPSVTHPPFLSISGVLGNLQRHQRLLFVTYTQHGNLSYPGSCPPGSLSERSFSFRRDRRKLLSPLLHIFSFFLFICRNCRGVGGKRANVHHAYFVCSSIQWQVILHLLVLYLPTSNSPSHASPGNLNAKFILAQRQRASTNNTIVLFYVEMKLLRVQNIANLHSPRRLFFSIHGVSSLPLVLCPCE